MPITDETIFDCDSHDKAVEVIKKLRDEDNIPDAIFAVNDITAVTTVNELNKYGIRVPEKVAVVGFTNGLLSELSSPMLTTIDQNGQLIGEKATKLLLERIETHVLTPYQTAVVPTKLVVRGSTVADSGAEEISARVSANV
jgi:LacI family transcriptional regulator